MPSQYHTLPFNQNIFVKCYHKESRRISFRKFILAKFKNALRNSSQTWVIHFNDANLSGGKAALPEGVANRSQRKAKSRIEIWGVANEIFAIDSVISNYARANAKRTCVTSTSHRRLARNARIFISLVKCCRHSCESSCAPANLRDFPVKVSRSSVPFRTLPRVFLITTVSVPPIVLASVPATISCLAFPPFFSSLSLCFFSFVTPYWAAVCFQLCHNFMPPKRGVIIFTCKYNAIAKDQLSNDFRQLGWRGRKKSNRRIVDSTRMAQHRRDCNSKKLIYQGILWSVSYIGKWENTFSIVLRQQRLSEASWLGGESLRSRKKQLHLSEITYTLPASGNFAGRHYPVPFLSVLFSARKCTQ